MWQLQNHGKTFYPSLDFDLFKLIIWQTGSMDVMLARLECNDSHMNTYHIPMSESDQQPTAV